MKRNETSSGSGAVCGPIWAVFPTRSNITYGLLCDETKDSTADYMCSVEVEGFDGLPLELDRMRLPRQTYAVFQHDGNMTTLQETRHIIWHDWYPKSGYRAAATPDFERYGELFDPTSGEGDMEIWIPIRVLIGPPYILNRSRHPLTPVRCRSVRSPAVAPAATDGRYSRAASS